MKKRYLILAASMALAQGCTITPNYPASTRVSVGVGSPGASIGIIFSSYPDLVPIPGYPVYYAPGLNSNYFFYDGLYWVFHGDNWYASGWYNGPWRVVGYYDVPVFILRVPVRYYRLPPPYFRHWHADAPPRWGERWGREWEDHHRDWDHWDRRAVPPPAPLPHYQRNYSGERYPRDVEQQQTIRSEHYRYQPRDPESRQYDAPRTQQEQGREREPRRQPELQRQDERREQEQRQLEQQRRRDQEREQYPRQIEQQRQQDMERERRQRPEPPRQQEQERERYPQRQQDERRDQYQQRQPEREQPRSQPESRDKGRDDRAAPQERGQQDRDARDKRDRKKKDDEREQNR